MIELQTLDIAETPKEVFTLFKQDAAIPDEFRDAVLRMYLKASLKAIQEAADKSMLPCTLKVIASEREGNVPVRLYQTPDEILSVTDGQGNAIPFTRDGRFIKLEAFTPCVQVTYKTKPAIADIVTLEAVVSQYAVAMYEHETPEVLNQIKAAAVC